LVLAKGIDMGILSINQIIDTSPGFINLSGRTVSDPKNYKMLTVSEVIAKSSQVGASKLALASWNRWTDFRIQGFWPFKTTKYIFSWSCLWGY
jgi:hypothetical protein